MKSLMWIRENMRSEDLGNHLPVVVTGDRTMAVRTAKLHVHAIQWWM